TGIEQAQTQRTHSEARRDIGLLVDYSVSAWGMAIVDHVRTDALNSYRHRRETADKTPGIAYHSQRNVLPSDVSVSKSRQHLHSNAGLRHGNSFASLYHLSAHLPWQIGPPSKFCGCPKPPSLRNAESRVVQKCVRLRLASAHWPTSPS